MLTELKNKIVYHGSYMEVREPDLSLCQKGKDFGQGFYITTDKRQAINFAKNIANRHDLSEGVLNVYKLSDLDDLQVYEFLDTNEEWLNCVIGYRKNQYKSFAAPFEQYEVLIGKIADDDTSQVINAYMQGVFGLVGSESAIHIARQRFLTNRLKNQICLKSEKALQKLEFVESQIVTL